MDAVARFAEEADAFREWAARGTDAGADAARTGLLHLTRLYFAGLELPPFSWADVVNETDAEWIGDAEWRQVFVAAGRLPLDYYGVVFDPSVVPPEEPVVGSLSVDIADIYGDIVRGLNEFQAGRRAVAHYEWGYNFRLHWGEHATGAIRVLHNWLAANPPDRLAVDD